MLCVASEFTSMSSLWVGLSNHVQGHQGCVNSLAWNAQGTLLISGSDDTRVCPIQNHVQLFVLFFCYLMIMCTIHITYVQNEQFWGLHVGVLSSCILSLLEICSCSCTTARSTFGTMEVWSCHIALIQVILPIFSVPSSCQRLEMMSWFQVQLTQR